MRACMCDLLGGHAVLTAIAVGLCRPSTCQQMLLQVCTAGLGELWLTCPCPVLHTCLLRS